MIRVPYAAVALLSLFVVSACGDSDRGLPTGPGPVRSGDQGPPPPAAPPPVGQPPSPTTGTIALIGVSPDAGNSLIVAPCFRGGAPRECAAAWSGKFEVTITNAVEWPVLTVRFYDGSTLCGYAAQSWDAVLPAGVNVFQPSTIYLTDEFGTFPRPCDLPAKATRMVAELWSDADGSFSVKQEFAISYTFIKP